MLPPNFLDALADDVTLIYEAYQSELINDMARRIAKLGVTDASAWQVMAYQEVGGVYEDAMQRLAAMSGQSHEALAEAFEAAGATSVSYDAKVYREAGLVPIPLNQSPAMLQALTAGLQKTQGSLDNWTLTTAVSGQHQYLDAVNRAYTMVMGGGFSVDQALVRVIRDIGEDGLWVLYHSGKRDRLDVAARRAIMTGISQTAGEITLANAADMGCDTVLVTAHMGARPSHAAWQGRVYSISGESNIFASLVPATGYGTGAGLKGWNCRHDMLPYFPGISSNPYTADLLEDYANAEVVYNGETIKLYEATQLQREMEREIRALKREWGAVKAAEAADMGLVSYKDAYEEVAAKLAKQRAALKDLQEQTGLRDQSARTQVYGFGRSEASSATWVARKALPKTAKAEDTTLQRTLTSDMVAGIIPHGARVENVRVIAGQGTSTELRAASYLAGEYGGKPSQWQKKGGIISTDNFDYDVHWEEWDGKQYRLKLKGIKAK